MPADAEDEGALDRHALAGVAGEGVGVPDVSLREVVAAELDPIAAVGHDAQRRCVPVDSLDGSARAVLDAERLGVAEADDAVAGSELGAGDREPLAPEPAVRLHQRSPERVQLGDVAAAKGDHHVAGEVVAGGGPPVGEQPRLRRDGRLACDEAACSFGEGEVVAAEAVADRFERAALFGVVLPPVLAQLDRAVALDDAGEEAAGADGRKLVRVADQDELCLRAARSARGAARGRASRPCRPRRR